MPVVLPRLDDHRVGDRRFDEPNAPASTRESRRNADVFARDARAEEPDLVERGAAIGTRAKRRRIEAERILPGRSDKLMHPRLHGRVASDWAVVRVCRRA